MPGHTDWLSLTSKQSEWLSKFKVSSLRLASVETHSKFGRAGRRWKSWRGRKEGIGMGVGGGGGGGEKSSENKGTTTLHIT